LLLLLFLFFEKDNNNNNMLLRRFFNPTSSFSSSPTKASSFSFFSLSSPPSFSSFFNTSRKTSPLSHTTTTTTTTTTTSPAAKSFTTTNVETSQTHQPVMRDGKRVVTMIPGDGIGPEISDAVIRVFSAASAPISWDIVSASTTDGHLPEQVVQSVSATRIGLKGPLATPIGHGHISLNLTLRKRFQLYANVRPALSIAGYPTRFNDVNVIVIRENTEGEYSGLEHQVIPGVYQSIKLITREATMRVAKHAFEYAVKHSRRRVTAVHKTSIMKLSDGLFVECCQEVATRYPTIHFDTETIDNICLKLVRDPKGLDVLVLPNLYGDIVSDLASGLIGGLGLTPSANIGYDSAVFEAVHGTAPDIAGQNKANPTALLLSGAMMLEYLGFISHSERIRNATLRTIANPKTRTFDLGGKSSTSQFADAIIAQLSSV